MKSILQAALICLVTVAVPLQYYASSPPRLSIAAKTIAAETKAERDLRMRWWREARFGMFIHWGLYAVPAGEYKGKREKGIGEWIMASQDIPREEYEKFAKQ